MAVLVVLARPGSAFDWQAFPSGEWVQIPTHGVAAPKVFHGGATIAPEHGEVYFFGSDTHAASAPEPGESNAVWRFDLDTRHWIRDYPADPISAYRVLANGQCETDAGRPWAMHTFDAVEYDPLAGRVVVVSFPEHTRFEPARRFPMFAGDWYQSLRPSHWEYDPETRQWQRLDTGPPDLFAQALTWDAARGQLVGHDGWRTYHFDRERGEWSASVAPSGGSGWHHTLVYDTHAAAPLSFGRNDGSSMLFRYTGEQWRVVLTEGSALPAEGAAIAYDSRNEVMLYLANLSEDQYWNASGQAATFLYDSRQRRWRRLAVSSPPLYGMNYLMQYDPVRNVVLHFEGTPESGGRLRVWAFRVR